VIGDKDQFIGEEQVEEQINLLQKNLMKFDLMRFKGGHEINAEMLKRIADH
jgi:predicted esterase